ncbi:MAG: hypothetical protein JWQ19_3246 [Subtercola sp.]|nr:hypothetical protein [Subtercola sp.]
MPILVIGIELAAVVLFFIALTLAFEGNFVGPTQSAASDASSYGEGLLVLLTVASILALVVVLLISFIIGWRILALVRVNRPAVAALAGLGTSLLPLSIVAAILYAVISTSADSSKGFFETPSLLALGVAAIVEIIAASIIGSVVWWWVSHLLGQRHTDSHQPQLSLRAETEEIRHQ